MNVNGRIGLTVVVLLTLLVFASGGQLPKLRKKRYDPGLNNNKLDNSTPSRDPYVEFWKQHNHGLCPFGQVAQRNNTVCCLPNSCKPGYGLEPCSSNGTEDVCVKCMEDQIQRHNVSSLNMTNTACFKPNENHRKCPMDDFHAVESGIHSSILLLPCVCAVEKCHWPEKGNREAGSCKTENTCLAGQQLNKFTGVCEPCPWYAYKDQPGCWPCPINVTLLRFGRPDPNAPTTVPTTPSTTAALSRIQEPEALVREFKTDPNESAPVFTTTVIALFSVLGAVVLGVVVVLGFVCYYQSQRSSNTCFCLEVARKLFGRFFGGSAPGSAPGLLSPSTSTPPTPTRDPGYSNLVDISSVNENANGSAQPAQPSLVCNGFQTTGAQSGVSEPSTRGHNSANGLLPYGGSVGHHGLRTGNSGPRGDNHDDSSPLETARNTDPETEPLLPVTPDNVRPTGRMYPDLSQFTVNDGKGSTSDYVEADMRPPEVLQQAYRSLDSEFSMPPTMANTAYSAAAGIGQPEAGSSDDAGLNTNSVREAACSNHVSTKRSTDLKAIGVEPKNDETKHKSMFSSEGTGTKWKCTGSNEESADCTSRAGHTTQINFNGPITNSVVKIKVDRGLVSVGGHDDRNQRAVETIHGRASSAARNPCNNMNEGISECVSRYENTESEGADSEDLPYNISVVKRDNTVLSDVASVDEKSCLESMEDSVDEENKEICGEKSVEVSSPRGRPVGRVSPMVQNRCNSNHSNTRPTEGEGSSYFSSGYVQAIMSQPDSHTRESLNSQENEGSRELQLPRYSSSNRPNVGSVSPSTALQMEELKCYEDHEYAAQTFPKTVYCDEDTAETTAERPGLQELSDPDQTERKEVADDDDSGDQTEVKGVAGMNED